MWCDALFLLDWDSSIQGISFDFDHQDDTQERSIRNIQKGLINFDSQEWENVS